MSAAGFGGNATISPAGGENNTTGRVPKWTKGTDCKSVIRGFESHLGLFRPSF
jgi:hypothetical protein